MVERPIADERRDARRAWTRPHLGVRPPRLVAMSRAEQAEAVEVLADLLVELLAEDGAGEDCE